MSKIPGKLVKRIKDNYVDLIPMRLHRRITIAPGIYRDGNQLVADVRCGSARQGTERRSIKRFPLATDHAVMVAWQLDAKAKLIRAAPATAERGSLAADIDRFLATLPMNRYRIDSEDLLTHWSESPIGPLRREAITRAEVETQMSAWIDAGVAENSVNHRLSRLRTLYRTLDDDDQNALAGIKRYRAADPDDRDIPPRIVKLIIDSLPDRGRAARGEKRPTYSETKIRIRVMAWTGHAQATILRIRPRDLDLAHCRVRLRPRRKGKGARAVLVALLDPAIEALRDFVAAGLLGKAWSNSSVWKTWQVGIARATATAERIAAETGDPSWVEQIRALPHNCHPYDMRHAFAAEVYRQTGDIGAVSELLQHSTIEMTKRYTRGGVSHRVTAAIAAAGATYAAIESAPPPTPPALTLVPRAAG